MKHTRFIAAVVIACSIIIQLSPAAAQGPANPSALQLVFAPRENVHVLFAAPAALPGEAWVGIVPSDVAHGSEAENDQYDLTYEYLQGRTSGVLTFEAPAAPGAYDIRMFDTDGDGKELASVTFHVVLTNPNIGKGTLTLAKTGYAPGEEITVDFTADPSFLESAWVGVIPSDVPHGSEELNDQYDLSYLYLQGQTSGTLTFDAPDEPGSYDFRMHDSDSDGVEVTSVTFTVQ